jgi:hypothetical protein
MELGRSSVVVAQGQVFEYFEEIRKIIETARQEVFFVDPYLDTDFVARYLPHVSKGVVVRLLGRKRMPALVAAVEMFAKQEGLTVEVRSAPTLHDRFLFVDRAECHLSGASFKDGAKEAPVTIAKVTDAFPAMWAEYDGMWNTAKVEL